MFKKEPQNVGLHGLQAAHNYAKWKRKLQHKQQFLTISAGNLRIS